MEVLKKSHFSLLMGNCPIPVAEDSGLNRFDCSQDSSFFHKTIFCSEASVTFNCQFSIYEMFENWHMLDIS